MKHLRAFWLSSPLLMGGLLYMHVRQPRWVACDAMSGGSFLNRLYSAFQQDVNYCSAVSMTKEWIRQSSQGAVEPAPLSLANKWTLNVGTHCKGKTKNAGPACEVCKMACGEDAYFVAHTLYGTALGVADGVGGWSKKGVDPAVFAWTLMNAASDHVIADAEITENGNTQVVKAASPLKILQKAYQSLLQSGKVMFGSSTACLTFFDTHSSTNNVHFYAANLGDSGYLIIRDNKVFFKSQEQQHRFNAPFQLTALPTLQKMYTPDKPWPSSVSKTSNFVDLPEHADHRLFELQDNDLVIIATDGFFDNVFPEEALQVVKEYVSQNSFSKAATPCGTNESLHSLAKILVKKAAELAQDEKRVSPFSVHASEHGYNYLGGKVDDITVVVAQIKRNLPKHMVEVTEL